MAAIPTLLSSVCQKLANFGQNSLGSQVSNISNPAITVFAGNQLALISEFLTGDDAIALYNTCKVTRYNNNGLNDEYWKKLFIKDVGLEMATKIEPGKFKEAYIKFRRDIKALIKTLPHIERLIENEKRGLSFKESFKSYLKTLNEWERGTALGQCIFIGSFPLFKMIFDDSTFTKTAPIAIYAFCKKMGHNFNVIPVNLGGSTDTLQMAIEAAHDIAKTRQTDQVDILILLQELIHLQKEGDWTSLCYYIDYLSDFNEKKPECGKKEEHELFKNSVELHPVPSVIKPLKSTLFESENPIIDIAIETAYYVLSLISAAVLILLLREIILKSLDS